MPSENALSNLPEHYFSANKTSSEVKGPSEIYLYELGIERIDSFKSLNDGWNGKGSLALGNDTIKRAKSFLCHIARHRPFISPTGRNSIQFEWGPFDNYLEFEVFSDKIIASCEFGGRNEEIEVTFKEAINLVHEYEQHNR
jgi:hypothetical protein